VFQEILHVYKMEAIPLVIEKLLKENIDNECFILSDYFQGILVLMTSLSSLIGAGLITTSKISCDGEDKAIANEYCIDQCYTVIGVDTLHPGA
jgi:hypothetical protein